MKVASLSMTVGQFLPGDSLVHRLDPRLKLLATFGGVAALFLVKGWLGLLIIAAGSGIVMAASRVPPSYLWRSIRPLLIILAVTFVLQLFGYPGTALVRLGPFTITHEGVREGGFLTARLGLLLLSSLMLTLTTPPVALTDAFEWLLSRLRRFGAPSHELALMMTIALRFIPTLFRELDDLVKAQKARGVDLSVRDPRRLSQAVLPLVVPLFVLSFRRADDLSIAMTSRCYRGGHGRSRYREMSFGALDIAGACLVGVWLVVALTAGRGWA